MDGALVLSDLLVTGGSGLGGGVGAGFLLSRFLAQRQTANAPPPDNVDLSTVTERLDRVCELLRDINETCARFEGMMLMRRGE